MALDKAHSLQPQDNLPHRLPWDERARPSIRPRRRAQSLSAPQENGTRTLVDRLKQTYEWTLTGNKGNLRSEQIHDRYITLKELLNELPESVSFDIELSEQFISHQWRKLF